MDTESSSTSLSESLSSIQQRIVASEFDGALADLAGLRESYPNSEDALYMSALCNRYTRNFKESLSILSRLVELVPDSGRAWQETGHTHRDMGQLQEALHNYTRACQLNAALEGSWNSIQKIATQLGRTRQAAHAKSNIERIKKTPQPLVVAADMIAEGKLLRAEDICRDFLKKVPHHIEAMRLLADIGLKLGVLTDAEFLLESAVLFAPENVQVRMDYIQALTRRQFYDKALEQSKHLLEKEPDSAQFQSLHAVSAVQAGDLDTALLMFDKVLTTLPNDPRTLTSKGHALKTRGDFDFSVDNYRQALLAHPEHGEAYYALANLKTYRYSDSELKAMHAQQANPQLTHMDRVYLSFALGKAYEDQGDYESSFSQYARGNALKKTQSRYSAEVTTRDIQSQISVCDAGFFRNMDGTGHQAPDPIFIVGLPRAGSTLLEQILSSHSLVDGTQELPNILSLSQSLRRRGRQEFGSDYPQILEKLDKNEFAEFGRTFIDETKIHRLNAPYFIDKMPNNFRHIGLIRLMLPNAKIIDARRHPMSCGFSVFKQLFAEGQEFSYSLEDIGSYYSDYLELMDHWNTVLPEFVLRVQHEDVVDDLESQVRRILEFCGLPYEESCLNYYETVRDVRTPSSEQVRQPIFKTALEQWRNYESELLPLTRALGPQALKRYPIEPLLAT